MPIERPRRRHWRSITGWLALLPHRSTRVRWIAASGAAICTLIAVTQASSNQPNTSPAATTAAADSLGTKLEDEMRGVVVPVSAQVFRTGDIVDIHSRLDAEPISMAATIIAVADSDLVIAVPASQVSAIVDALTTGGVALALVPPDT